jgi:hypothetical protein
MLGDRRGMRQKPEETMKETRVPFWLANAVFTGREDDDDLEELKAALKKEREEHRKERKLRRKAERDARKKQTQDKDEADDKDLEAAKERVRQSEEKTKKLGTRLLNRERDAAILEAAREAGFIDPTDALTDKIRAAVEYDQDDEDPSDIEIDEDSAAEAVEKLAKQKKHLLKSADDDEEPEERERRSTRSGSRRRKKTSKGVDDAALEKQYNI